MVNMLVRYCIDFSTIYTQHPNTINQSTQHFNGHFPNKPRLAGCPFDSQSPVILSVNILTDSLKPFIYSSNKSESAAGFWWSWCSRARSSGW